MSFYRIKKMLHSPFRTLFNEAELLPNIRKSISMMVLGNIFGNLFGVVTTGSALTGYAAVLGANDFVFGVLTGIPLAATLIQIPAAILVSRTQRRKKYMLTFGVVARALWLVVGLVPYFMPSKPAWLRLWSVIFLVGMSAASGSFINVCFTPWMADLIPIGIRGRWMSMRDGMNAIGSVAIGLITAFILDHSSGYTGYALVFLLGGTLGVLDMCCFIFVKEVHRTPPINVNIVAVGKQIFADKPFLRFMLFWTAWNFTANLSGPFLARYALGEMGLTYMQVTLCSQIAAALITVLVITTWGKLLDRYGCKPVLWVSCVVASLTPGFFLFSVYGSVLPMLLHNVVGAAFWCAANLAALNMLLANSPDHLRPSYVAFFSCFASLLGAFLGVLSGGALLELIQGIVKSHAALLGAAPDRYKILIAVSVVARFAIVLYFIPKLQNEQGFTVAAMCKDILHASRK